MSQMPPRSTGSSGQQGNKRATGLEKGKRRDILAEVGGIPLRPSFLCKSKLEDNIRLTALLMNYLNLANLTLATGLGA